MPSVCTNMNFDHRGVQNGPRIFISAAEPSGDLHASNLIREVRSRCPKARFQGVAGEKMQSAGCEPIFDMTAHSAMLAGAVANVGRAISVLRNTSDALSRHHFDAAVVVDSPVLNLPIALRAKMRNIPVLYYIAPQLWAWGAWRVHKIRARVDKLAVVLPFEEEYFRSLGLDATYVGHPLFDELRARAADDRLVSEIRGAGKPVIALLPGSRKHVVGEVLPGQLAVARAIRHRFPRARVGVSIANQTVADVVQRCVSESAVPAEMFRDRNAEWLSAADLTLVASGTATLEVAYYGSPMVVMYNGSRSMYKLIGRWLITLKHFSLINILAGEELVPEFMPYYNSTVPIGDCAVDLLSSPDRLARIRSALSDLIAPMSAAGASSRTAQLLLEMTDQTH